MVGFWGTNIGLIGMIGITLVPVGVLQAIESFQNGFWSARSWSFYQQPIVSTLLWLRMFPDSVFIVLGAVPLVAGSLYGLLHLRRTSEIETLQTIEPEERELAGASYSKR